MWISQKACAHDSTAVRAERTKTKYLLHNVVFNEHHNDCDHEEYSLMEVQALKSDSMADAKAALYLAIGVQKALDITIAKSCKEGAAYKSLYKGCVSFGSLLAIVYLCSHSAGISKSHCQRLHGQE